MERREDDRRGWRERRMTGEDDRREDEEKEEGSPVCLLTKKVPSCANLPVSSYLTPVLLASASVALTCHVSWRVSRVMACVTRHVT